jgi:hypothetical protein
MRELSKHPNRELRFAAATALFILTISGGALGQGTAAPPQDLTIRENKMSEIERSADRKTSKPKDPRVVLEQVNEDFGHLQDVNNDLLKSVAPGKTLDAALISVTTEEIRMRSLRLKENLTLPEGKDKKREKVEVGPDDAQLRAGISALNDLIQSFVTNPVFKSNAVEPQQAAKARHDLEGIIDLSDRIRKAAEKMKKSG